MPSLSSVHPCLLTLSDVSADATQDEAEAAAKDAASKDQGHVPPSKAAAAAAAQKAALAASLEADDEYAKLEHKFKVQLGLIEPDDKDKS